MKRNFFNEDFVLKLFSPDGADGSGTSADSTDGASDSSMSNTGVKLSGTFIEKRDPVSGATVKIPKELDNYIGHIISSTRNAAEGKFKPLVEKLESDTAEFAEVKLELEKLREQSMTAEEKAQANASRKIAEHENKMKKAMDEADTWRTRFQSSMVTNDIMSAFGDVKLCNPEQTAILLRNEGNAEVVEVLGPDGKPTGQFQTRIRLELKNDKSGELEILEGTPKELFKRWINEDRNLHHQMNNLMPGAGSNSTTSKNVRGQDWLKMSAEERLRRARE